MTRETLQKGRAHLTVSGTFQSDKYRWCPAGLVPLKMSDPDAVRLLVDYGFIERIASMGPYFPLPNAFVLVSVEDRNGRNLLREYAPIRGKVDKEFERDLLEAITNKEAA